jgi:hypothetical protein
VVAEEESLRAMEAELLGIVQVRENNTPAIARPCPCLCSLSVSLSLSLSLFPVSFVRVLFGGTTGPVARHPVSEAPPRKPGAPVWGHLAPTAATAMAPITGVRWLMRAPACTLAPLRAPRGR